jgi:hypothetical protein
MGKLNLNTSLQSFLIHAKIRNLINTSDRIDSQKLMKEIKEKLTSENYFEYSKPAVQKKDDETES